MITTIPKVSLIIVNLDRFSLTYSCIKKHIKKLTYANYDIIIVDDDSTDASLERLKESFPEATVVQNKGYAGYCKAHNIGMRKALENKADYVAIVHNDSKDYSPNYLEEVVKVFTKDNKVGLVGSKALSFDNRILWGGENHEKFGVKRNTPDSGFVIRSKLLKEIGLLDETLVAFFEDLDFIIRVRKAGYKTAFVPNVSYVHMGGGTKSQFGFFYHYYRLRNIFWFIKKHRADIPFKWKAREIKRSVLTHILFIPRCLKQGKIKDAIRVMAFVFCGLIVGIFLPYKENIKIKYD